MNYREKMREYIKCPQFGNINYGKWGTLNIEQRAFIKRLLDEMDRADEYIKTLYFKNENLQFKIDKAIEIDKIARKYFNKQIPRNIREQGFLNEIYNYLCDIEDILKEDK